MSNKVVIIILILVIAVVGIIWWTGQGADEEITTPTPNESVTPTDEKNESEEETAGDMEMREFDVEGSEFTFSRDELNVNEGETVKINFLNAGDINHDWVIDEFNANTALLDPGETDSVTFTANESGMFEYYCSVPGHRHQGMIGTLTVE